MIGDWAKPFKCEIQPYVSNRFYLKKLFLNSNSLFDIQYIFSRTLHGN